MIEVKKTGMPKEVAESLRRIADQIEVLPPFLRVTIHHTTAIEKAVPVITPRDMRIQAIKS